MNVPGPGNAGRTPPAANPLAWLAAAFVVGIAAAGVFGPDWLFALAAAGAFAGAAYYFRAGRIAPPALLVSFVFLGAFAYQFELDSLPEDRLKRIYDEGRVASGTPVRVEGRLIGRPEPAHEGAFLRLRAEALDAGGGSFSVSGVVRLFVPLNGPEQVADLETLALRAGDRIRASCPLTREDQYLNPGVTPRRTMLDQQGVDATATVKSPLLIEVLQQAEWISPLDAVYEQRQWLIDEFRGRFAPRTAGVLIASLLGDKHFLDRETAEVFRDGGTFHVLVISGLHITFIGGIVLGLVALGTRDRIWQLLITALVLWLYTLAVGAEVPVVRASIMFTALLISRAMYRTGTLLNTLGLCCLLLLAWRPADLFGPSFQLTVVSVAAIVGSAFPLIEKLRAIGRWMPDASSPFPPNVPAWLRRFCEMLYWRPEAWEIEKERQVWSGRILKNPLFGPRLASGAGRAAAYLFEGFVVSVIVQAWMLPLLVYYFHRVSPLSVVLNLWVGVVMAGESFAALLAVMFGQLSDALAMPFAALTDGLNWLMVAVPGLFVNFDWASVRVPIYAGQGKALYFVYFAPVLAFAVILIRWEPFALNRSRMLRRLALPSAAWAALAAVIVFHPFSAPAADGRLRVDLLDVGQGDSALVTFPNGETMLIDGGGRLGDTREEDEDSFEPDLPRIGEMVVSEFLWEKGYSRVDRVIVSHADADHSQGLVDVVRNFGVGEIWMGNVPTEDPALTELLTAANSASVPVRQLGRGDRIEIGGATVEVLWPAASAEAAASDNNSSLVMRLTFGEVRFLFTGDIEKEAEAALLEGGTDLSAEVVKVPHHGSRTSSTDGFVSAAGPRIAVIPVGRRSMFGHPHAEVLERWRMIGSAVMTTGERGTITFVTDGASIDRRTFLEE